VNYDPETGVMIWVNTGRRISNKDKDGYLTTSLRINGKRIYYRVHRLAWLYVYGEFPKGPLDHINRIKIDNRICNLRIADDSLNSHNIEMWNTNKSGIKGVSWYKRTKKWQAILYWRGKSIFLGTYANIEDAKDAYAQASLKYAKEFSIYSEVRV
jgi:hypothetical protein